MHIHHNSRKATLISAACLCLLGFYSLSLADMVYLKNSQSIEGIVTKQDDTTLTLDAGYGIITIQKERISRIGRYTPAAQEELRNKTRAQFFLRPDFVPAALSDLTLEFNALESARTKAVASKLQRDHAETQIEAMETQLQKLKAEAAEVNMKISGFTPERNIKEYNSLIEKINSLMSLIGAKEYYITMLRAQSPGLEKIVGEYLDTLRAFNENFSRRYRAQDKNSMKQAKYFFEGIARRLEEMDSDFTKQTVSYKASGSNIVVYALLNNLVSASLVLDTGASLVTISQAIAQKLGVLTKGKEATLQVSLADGRKVDAIPVVLGSIKIGDIEAKNIPAVILKDAESCEDGLLGMSFLSNFIVKIDPKGNKLLFEQFNP